VFSTVPLKARDLGAADKRFQGGNVLGVSENTWAQNNCKILTTAKRVIK